MATAAIPLAENVWRIPTAPASLINSYAFKDADGQVTLVDTGISTAPPRILAALAGIGSAPSEVTRILLTHAHGDHAGGVAKLAARTGGGIAVHEDDADFVRSGKAPPLDRHSLQGKLMKRMPGFKAAPVAEELHDGDVLPIGGGLRVLHTPGHSPGHVSFLHESSGLLITGDAIWNVRARMSWPILSLCTNIAMTQQTAAVLGEVEYTIVGFTHGPHIADGAREAVRGFLRAPRKFRAAF